jgi:hypothetical protein
MKMWHHRVLVLGIFLAASTSVYAGDTVKEYAQKCDAAIGITIPMFTCDAKPDGTGGTEVPDTHPTHSPADYPKGKCDRPNELNKECDPGSRFQVLHGSNDHAYAVAHCRKQGRPPGSYGDIAVIQHNKDNGATCFYQRIAEKNDKTDRLSGVDVTPPSQQEDDKDPKGWMTPAAIEKSNFRCGGCHDNGPIIRSPYLSQVKKDGSGKYLLPGGRDSEHADGFNNVGQPYYFVGTDFAAWRAYQVEVTVNGSKNTCNGCHRMGVSNVGLGKHHDEFGGTSLKFGLTATAKEEKNPVINADGTVAEIAYKNPHSGESPIWMTPVDTTYDKNNETAAMAIKTCADQLNSGSPLRNKESCKITQFAGRWKLAAVRWQDAKAYFYKGHRVSVFSAKPESSNVSDPKPIDIEDLWTGGIDAAMLWGNGKAYVFMGDQYFQYDVKTNKVDKGFPKPIKAGHWDLPDKWTDGIDAAVPWRNDKDYTVYFFKGDQYIQYNVAAQKSDAPKPIKDGFPGVVWKDGIDTAIQWDDEDAYFFKDDQYIKYKVKDKKAYPGYPKPIKGNWPYVTW